MANNHFITNSKRRGLHPFIAQWLAAVFGVLATLILLQNARAGIESEATNASPLQLYNNGTRKLREGKLQEAEATLQGAVASQNERVQPGALYNLGEIRYQQGADILKKGSSPSAASSSAKKASENSVGAISAADEALSGDDIGKIAMAYLRGRGARKDLRSAREAVKKAMETYSTALGKWQRSLGDFKSAHELQSTNFAAQTNAEIMDKYIAKLIDQQQMMSQAMQAMNQQRSELKQKMDALKKKMPKDMGEKMGGQNGEDEDDDEGEEKGPPQPKPGEEEAGKTGGEMLMTSEEAGRLLDMLKLDNGRKLSMAGDKGEKPKKHSGRDW